MRQSIERKWGGVLSEAELAAVVAATARQDDQLLRVESRSSRRFLLLENHHVVLGFNDGFGRSVTIAPVVRGVSRGGLTALHSAPLPCGLRLACLFVGPERAPGLRVPGVITRCLPIRGSIYEIGVAFEEPAAIYPHVRLESDDPMTPPLFTRYPAIETAKRQFVEMVADGAPLANLREALADLHLAIDAEEKSRAVRVDPNTGAIGPEELDRVGDCTPEAA